MKIKRYIKAILILIIMDIVVIEIVSAKKQEKENTHHQTEHINKQKSEFALFLN